MRIFRWTLVLAVTLLIGALAATLSTGNADSDAYDFSGKAWPSDFAEKYEDEFYRHGKWTFQRVDHTEFGAMGPTSSLNVYFCDMPVKRFSLGRDGGGVYEDLPAKRVYAKEDENRANSQLLPLFDMTGDGTPCLVMGWTDFPMTREHHVAIYRVVEDKKHPEESKVVEIYHDAMSYGSTDIVDLDGDRIPELIDSQGTGFLNGGATAVMLCGSFPTVEKWNLETGRYETADPRLLLSPEVKDGHHKATTEEERETLRKSHVKALVKKIKVAQQGPGKDRYDGQIWNLYSDFSSLVFYGATSEFAEIFGEYCPEKLEWWEGDKREVTKKELWDWLVTSTKSERERFKKWLPKILDLKTSDETKTDTPWK